MSATIWIFIKSFVVAMFPDSGTLLSIFQKQIIADDSGDSFSTLHILFHKHVKTPDDFSLR
jgi:hypothetical protein